LVRIRQSKLSCSIRGGGRRDSSRRKSKTSSGGSVEGGGRSPQEGVEIESYDALQTPPKKWSLVQLGRA